ncbi:MAG: hypothetical protein HOW97_38735 [Catenulispora sp.]|nr:hypothetical protein [Catenulispora sp.]
MTIGRRRTPGRGCEVNESWKPRELSPDELGTGPGAGALLEYLAGADLAGMLTAEKAIVFRGFGVRPDELDGVLDVLLPDRLAYVHGNSPRTKVGRNVYTSTEYPPQYTIAMHNEMSYAAHWPSRLAFFCETTPGAGGATPVVDGELWLASIDPAIREAFAGGVRYVQNLHDGYGLGKSWQQTFETEDRSQVDEFLATAEADWEWRPDGSLRVSQVRASTVRHPVTGAEVWFCQADQWHPGGLGDDTAKALAQIMAPEDLPQNAFFADGGEIPNDYVLHVQNVGLEAAVDVPWHAGDLLVIDNVLVGHGRRPFDGPRRVLVAMSGSPA